MYSFQKSLGASMNTPFTHFSVSRFEPMRSPRITFIRVWTLSTLIGYPDFDVGEGLKLP